MDKLTIVKLDGRNDFMVWKVQMRSYLFACGWLAAVSVQWPYGKGPGVVEGRRKGSSGHSERAGTLRCQVRHDIK